MPTTDVDCEDMMTTSEAAALARCSEATIRAWTRGGRLPAFRFGPRRLVIPRHELLALLKSQSVRG